MSDPQVVHPFQRFKKLVSWSRQNPLGVVTALMFLVLFAAANQMIGSFAGFWIDRSHRLLITIYEFSDELANPTEEAPTIHAPQTIGSDKYANFDIFLCEKSNSDVGNIFRFADELASKNLFHRVRVRYIEPSDFPKEFPRDFSVIVYDAPHDEKGWLHFLMSEIHEARIFPPPMVLPNADAETPWYLSMYVCKANSGN